MTAISLTINCKIIKEGLTGNGSYILILIHDFHAPRRISTFFFFFFRITGSSELVDLSKNFQRWLLEECCSVVVSTSDGKED